MFIQRYFEPCACQFDESNAVGYSPFSKTNVPTSYSQASVIGGQPTHYSQVAIGGQRLEYGGQPTGYIEDGAGGVFRQFSKEQRERQQIQQEQERDKEQDQEERNKELIKDQIKVLQSLETIDSGSLPANGKINLPRSNIV